MIGRIATACVLLSSFAIGTQLLGVFRPNPTSTLGGVVAYTPTDSLPSGTEIIFVYLGSSACGWSNLPDVAPAVSQIKARLAADARSQGHAFKAIGIAIDWDLQAGIHHLDAFGGFDEISVGDNLGNTLAVDFFWERSRVPASPQIAVFRADLDVVDDSLATMSVVRSALSPVVSARGLTALRRWAQSNRVLAPSASPRLTGDAPEDFTTLDLPEQPHRPQRR